MVAYLSTTIFIVLVSWFVTYIINTSSLFEKLRIKIAFFECPICLSFHLVYLSYLLLWFTGQHKPNWNLWVWELSIILGSYFIAVQFVLGTKALYNAAYPLNEVSDIDMKDIYGEARAVSSPDIDPGFAVEVDPFTGRKLSGE